MPGEVIAIATHKGGQSKTTTSCNLAAGLTQAGWRTLLVDVDPQANATEMFGCDDADTDLYSVLANGVPIEKAIHENVRAGLDVVPSSLWGAQLDRSLMQQYHREARLRKALSPVLDTYDAVVLDLPPTLGQLVITSLAAADSLIVPTDASKWGWRGVRMFLEWADELRTAEVLHAELLGVLLTKYEPQTRISREVDEAITASDLPSFETRIPKRTAAERMAGDRLVLGDEGADEDLVDAYGHLTLEVIHRVRERREREGGKHRG